MIGTDIDRAAGMAEAVGHDVSVQQVPGSGAGPAADDQQPAGRIVRDSIGLCSRRCREGDRRFEDARRDRRQGERLIDEALAVDDRRVDLDLSVGRVAARGEDFIAGNFAKPGRRRRSSRCRRSTKFQAEAAVFVLLSEERRGPINDVVR